MESIEGPAQTGEQSAALVAFGEVVVHSGTPAWSELAVDVVRHPAGGPPVVPLETLSIQQSAHSTSDPLGLGKGSHTISRVLPRTDGNTSTGRAMREKSAKRPASWRGTPH
jgi:hypothetical protein